jgi:hypothetical protein
MPIPIIIGAAAIAAGVYGAKKAFDGIMEWNDANDIDENARSMVDSANEKIKAQHKAAKHILFDYGKQKKLAFDGVIPEFIKTYEGLKKVKLTQNPELDNLAGDFNKTLASLRQYHQALQGAGLGLNFILGDDTALLAFGAYSAPILLGAASTDTAIVPLNETDVPDANLDYMDRDPAALLGVSGIAIGSLALSSLIAGPAWIIAGHMIAKDSEECLDTARNNMEEAETFCEKAELLAGKLKAIKKAATFANHTFAKISARLSQTVDELKKVIENNGVEFPGYSDESKAVVFRSVKYAQLLKAMLDAPILDEKGELVLSTAKRMEEVALVANSEKDTLTLPSA